MQDENVQGEQEEVDAPQEHEGRRAEYDEEQEDEEDEEDEEEELSGKKSAKRAKHRHKRSAASRFIDIEAEVSDEDEDEEEEGDYADDGFIESDVEDDASRRHHAMLTARTLHEQEDRSPEQIAKDLSKRYGGRGASHYTGDTNEIPQRLLMPSVHDASLWQVRVKAGRERDIVLSLMRKSIDVEFTAKPLQILAAFQRDSLPGMVYVEARSAKQVIQAVNGLVGVYISRGIHLVPIEEMASLLQIKKQEQTVTPGTWVRIRRGKYAGDLAQVVDITENGEDVGLRFIPRIDLTPRDDAAVDGKKRKKQTTGTGTMRPPQRLFNYEEVIKVYGRKLVSKRNQVYVFQNETYREGFIEKDFKLSALSLEDVNPTLDEIQQFSRKQDSEGDNLVDLSVIAEASRKAAISVLQPGDHVEVFEGEQAGVHGVVEEISGDVVTITAKGVELEGQKIELPARSVRKRFKPGDHVKVMSGQNTDETGLVVSVVENIVTFISDMSMQEISVFSKDLREAAEVGSSTNVVGNYELHDLVQLDAQTVGVIFRTERDSFRVLDQNGQVRLVQPHQISMSRNSNRAIAVDSEGHEIRVNDNMKEVDGEARKGRVLHIYQSFYAFLHNREYQENGGVFVTRTRSLASVAPKGSLVKPTGDLSKMNPAVMQPTGGMVGSGNMGRGPRDRHIGLTVTIVKGPQKGYAGTIKDTNGNICRVELRTGNKIITIEKDKLRERQSDGTLTPLDGRPRGPPGGRTWGGPPQARATNPYAEGGRTPGWGVGRTPNPYADGKTPAWNASSRTPNPYADGGKTPAWNASSRTPNPYADGGKTPAWNASSRTPNPYASGGGAAGWATPRPNSNAGAGWATPGPTATNNNGWGDSSPAHSTSGATPGAPGWGSASGWAGGDTWGPASAPTPAPSAPTPAVTGTPYPSTPAAYPRTPAGVSRFDGSSYTAATPAGGSLYPDDLEPSAEHGKDEEEEFNWLFDSALGQHLKRVKVQIHGTHHANYLGGDYEGKVGRVLGAAKAAEGFEQTAMIEFEDGESRSILARYIVPVEPHELRQEVLVIRGQHKGTAAKVHETPDSAMVALVVKGPEQIRVLEAAKHDLAVLYDT
ncbi:transcription elongation factor SPT5 [Amanita muscaria]